MKNNANLPRLHEVVIIFIVLIIIVIFSVVVWRSIDASIKAQRYEEEQQNFEKITLKTVKSMAHEDWGDQVEYVLIDKVDAWGNTFRYHRIIGKDQITHIVTSAGRDGKFDTIDDLMGQDIDTNYSKVIGRTITDQALEFGKGLKEGWGHKNQFEKVDEKR